MRLPVYLDYHATTPCDPEVVAAMQPFFTEFFGNASSRQHGYGRQAESAVEVARGQIAEMIHAAPKEVILTSGATESNNLAIKGVVDGAGKGGRHLITAATEHASVLEACRHLERQDHQVSILSVDRFGVIDPEELRRALRPETVLVSIAMANNEIGTVAAIAEVAHLAHEHDVLVHSDVAQAVGKVPVDVKSLGLDLASLSAHKMYGPKGSGALYLRSGLAANRLAPLLHGGGQERGLRPGTLNVPAIVGFGKAAELWRGLMATEIARVLSLRTLLHDLLKEGLPDLALNGHPAERLPGNLNLSLPGTDSEALLAVLRKDVALSSGAACSSDVHRPSHVLQAIGVRPELIAASLRIGIGRFSTEEEIRFAAWRLIEAASRLRRSARPAKATAATKIELLDEVH